MKWWCVCGHGDVCVSLAAARAALHRFIQSRDSERSTQERQSAFCFFVFSLLWCFYRTVICLGTSLGRSRSHYHSHKLRDDHTLQSLRTNAHARVDRRVLGACRREREKPLQSLFSDDALLTDSSSVGTGHFSDVEVGRSPTR